MSKPKNQNGFSRRDFLEGGSATTLMTMLGTLPVAAQSMPSSTSAAPKDSDPHAGFPRVWLSSPEGAPPVANFEDLVSPAGMAYGATLRAGATTIAKAGGQCCAWRLRDALFSSFLPKDPFDDGEYVRWLLTGDIVNYISRGKSYLETSLCINPTIPSPAMA